MITYFVLWCYLLIQGMAQIHRSSVFSKRRGVTVPLHRELRLTKPLFLKKMSSSLTSWHRKYFYRFYDFAILSFFLLGCIKPVPSCSDDEEPQKDAADAPSTRATTPEEPSAQEVEPAVLAPRTTRSSIKKVPVTRSTKRSKKSKEMDVALEAHGPAASSDDVSKYP
jgi:hypothetical protein